MGCEALKNIRKTEWDRLKACLIPTFVIGLIAHAYGFLHNIFSHDSLNAFYADVDEEKWKIALGRFLVPVVRKTLTGSVALPWIIGLISLLFISFSVYFIIKMFDFDYSKKIPMVLISGIMVANVTVISCIATYIYEFHFDMLALLFACISAYIWSKYDKIKWYSLSAVFAVASIALYQSYFEITLLLMILFSIVKLLDGDSFKKVFVKAMKGLLTSIVAFVVYYALYKVITLVTGIQPEKRTFIFSVDSLSGSVYSMLKRIAYSYLKPASVVYPRVLIAAVIVLILIITVILVLDGMKKLEKDKTKEKILVLLLGIAAVVSINIVEIAGTKTHDLMKYSFWLVLIFPIILLFTDKFKYKSVLKYISLALVGIFIWNNVLASNTAYIKRDNEQGATLSVMTRVINDLEKMDGYEIGESEIVFYGHIDALRTEKEKEFSSIIDIEGMRYKTIAGSLEPNWYFNCYEAYFKYFLDYPINYSQKTFSNRAEVQSMPCYPNDGYIQKIDGVYVVKLGSIDNMLKNLNSQKS